MENQDHLNEFEAAVLLRMTPQLLRWFTSYAPKQGIGRKLACSRIGERWFYSRSELQSFDAFLREPWPASKGERPSISKGIQHEIRTEGFFQCAVCHSHADSCEIAHIEPVATSKNNHPHNLILLCGNHHTKYDKDGVLGPREEVRDVVREIKGTLLFFTQLKWQTYADALVEAFALTQFCAHVKKHLMGADAEKFEVYQECANQVVQRLDNAILRTWSKRDRSNAHLEEIWGKLEKTTTLKTVEERLAYAEVLSEDIDLRVAAGFVKCPLCIGAGTHGNWDCPVCNGERYVDPMVVKRLDIAPFAFVKCPLCKGSGRHETEICPVCHGDREIERRVSEQVDVSDFSLVKCPLCCGKGRHNGDDCPVCQGDRRIPRRVADQVDVSKYDDIKCPICEGDGQGEDGNPCRACRGDGSMPRERSEQLDRSDYMLVKCRLCNGSGVYLERSCPPCGGDGRLLKITADQVDWRSFELVKCVVCSGKGQVDWGDCQVCGGNGKLPRIYADNE